jgi:hypothetical protein
VHSVTVASRPLVYRDSRRNLSSVRGGLSRESLDAVKTTLHGANCDSAKVEMKKVSNLADRDIEII